MRKKTKSQTGRKKKTPQGIGTNIQVGNISNSTGIAIGEGAKAYVDQHHGYGNIDDVFAMIEKELSKIRDEGKRSDANKAVVELKKEAQKGEQADENRVKGWFSFLANIAPDVWEVAVDTFINPIKGVSTLFKKVAEKAKAEKEKG